MLINAASEPVWSTRLRLHKESNSVDEKADRVHCCSVDFDMTFDDTLRDGSSFGKRYENVSFSLLLVMFKHKG